jgi:hypothetical protein
VFLTVYIRKKPTKTEAVNSGGELQKYTDEGTIFSSELLSRLRIGLK